MARTFQDPDLMTWEAYASSGKFGMPTRAHIVFRCLSDPTLRARVVETDGDCSEAEKVVAASTAAELGAMFEAAEPLD